MLKRIKKSITTKRNNKITENIYRHSKNDSFNNRLVAKTNKSIVTKGDLYKIDKAINDETKDYLNQIEYENYKEKLNLKIIIKPNLKRFGFRRNNMTILIIAENQIKSKICGSFRK